MRIKTFARLRDLNSGDDFTQGKREGSVKSNNNNNNKNNNNNNNTCVYVNELSGMVLVKQEDKLQKNDLQFAFDGAFDASADQEKVFQNTTAPLVEDALSGINGTVFAYGQTSSGKTYTMAGGPFYETRGVIPRAISKLFEDKRLLKCEISYVEVYNEVVLDLLDQRKKVHVYSINEKKMHLKNLTVKTIVNEEQALDLFFQGNMQRSTGCTALNMSSSRSHCVFTIKVETKSTSAQLNFVDLAGSERTQDHTSKHINLSLHFLEQVVLNLQNQQQHIGFRNSTMTALLRESLGGNCQTIFIITLNPIFKHLSESLSTCRFAQRCRSLSTNIAVNESLEQKVDRLEKENFKLKKDLEFALESLREHDKVRDMLRDLLEHMDKDMGSIISSEATFINDIDIQVDIEDDSILLTNSKNCKTMQIKKNLITRVARTLLENGNYLFQLFGVFSDNQQKNNNSPTEQQIIGLEYSTDGLMIEQISWLQAFEHWLGPQIDDDEEKNQEEEERDKDQRFEDEIKPPRNLKEKLKQQPKKYNIMIKKAINVIRNNIR